MTESRWSGRTETVIQGQFKVCDTPGVILSTVLGSCVAACLYDEHRQIGGMNHYLLPEGGRGSREMKYGAMAMELLINGLLRAGADRRRLKAKLFGGARITRTFDDIGARNARFAQDFMAMEEIPVVARSLGGDLPRRVHFLPLDGRARVLLIDRAEEPAIVAPQPMPQAPITLF
ncbi:chemotaxis protein CheD [Wenxinia marina]|uniref:Probable chemoreceptor glutamine deamidase CheD n=1 Tax=Wenxinia marina DSM 24838 TaxID=1123501 RepID=A0A0D0NGD9_9RHOB|nr:chemotaxis protein CheD [Wenxinia marina]KIQ67400.1 Chemotaxis protein [Wenxinia marina DSM 24838]GGL69772.1 putative chemoreceptor glutamine deamidase CheD [Wenxinia marina]